VFRGIGWEKKKKVERKAKERGGRGKGKERKE